jgi:hypothetical protein
MAGAEPELEHHPDYLAYLEDIDPAHRLYFALTREDSVVAISQAVHTSSLTLPLSRPAEMLAALPGVQAEYEHLLYPSIVVRNLWDCLPLTGVEPGAGRHWWAAMAAAIEEHGRAAGARSVTWLNGPEPASDLGSLLISRGYGRGLYCAIAEIDLAGVTSFEGYTRRFSGDTRRGILRERRRFRAAGLTVRRLSADRDLPSVVSQEAGNWGKYGEDVDPGYLYRLRKSLAVHLGERARLLGVANADGADIASGIHLVGKDFYHVFTFGADYSSTDLAACYPELTFYAAIEAAIALGCRRVNLGYEGYQAKVLRGAQLRSMYAYVLAFEPAGRRFATAMLSEVDSAVGQQLASLTWPRLTGSR